MEQGDGYCEDGPLTWTVTVTQPHDSSVQFIQIDTDSLIRRQAAAIEEFTHLVGYLPEAYAVLVRHGLR